MVVLTRQFRYPSYVSSHHRLLIEACAAMLEEADPEHVSGKKPGRIPDIQPLDSLSESIKW